VSRVLVCYVSSVLVSFLKVLFSIMKLLGGLYDLFGLKVLRCRFDSWLVCWLCFYFVVSIIRLNVCIGLILI